MVRGILVNKILGVRENAGDCNSFRPSVIDPMPEIADIFIISLYIYSTKVEISKNIICNP